MNTVIISSAAGAVFTPSVFNWLWSRLFARVDRRGTVWQVAAIPLGGYVRFKGTRVLQVMQTPALDDMDAAERRSTMHGAPFGRGPATVAAGPIFNFILSLICFWAVDQSGVTKTADSWTSL